MNKVNVLLITMLEIVASVGIIAGILQGLIFEAIIAILLHGAMVVMGVFHHYAKQKNEEEK